MLMISDGSKVALSKHKTEDNTFILSEPNRWGKEITLINNSASIAKIITNNGKIAGSQHLRLIAFEIVRLTSDKENWLLNSQFVQLHPYINR